MACICRSKNDKDANSIFVEVFADFTDIKTIFGFLLDRDNSSFDFEVTCEFPIGKTVSGEGNTQEQLGRLHPSRCWVWKNRDLRN